MCLRMSSTYVRRFVATKTPSTAFSSPIPVVYVGLGAIGSIVSSFSEDTNILTLDILWRIPSDLPMQVVNSIRLGSTAQHDPLGISLAMHCTHQHSRRHKIYKNKTAKPFCSVGMCIWTLGHISLRSIAGIYTEMELMEHQRNQFCECEKLKNCMQTRHCFATNNNNSAYLVLTQFLCRFLSGFAFVSSLTLFNVGSIVVSVLVFTARRCCRCVSVCVWVFTFGCKNEENKRNIEEEPVEEEEEEIHSDTEQRIVVQYNDRENIDDWFTHIVPHTHTFSCFYFAFKSLQTHAYGRAHIDKSVKTYLESRLVSYTCACTTCTCVCVCVSAYMASFTSNEYSTQHIILLSVQLVTTENT